MYGYTLMTSTNYIVFPHFIVESNGLRPTPVQGIAATQWSLPYNRIREVFGFLSIVKFTFPLKFHLIVGSCFLLKRDMERSYRSARKSPLRVATSRNGWHVPKTEKELAEYISVFAVTVHAEEG